MTTGKERKKTQQLKCKHTFAGTKAGYAVEAVGVAEAGVVGVAGVGVEVEVVGVGVGE